MFLQLFWSIWKHTRQYRHACASVYVFVFTSTAFKLDVVWGFSSDRAPFPEERCCCCEGEVAWRPACSWDPAVPWLACDIAGHKGNRLVSCTCLGHYAKCSREHVVSIRGGLELWSRCSRICLPPSRTRGRAALRRERGGSRDRRGSGILWSACRGWLRSFDNVLIKLIFCTRYPAAPRPIIKSAKCPLQGQRGNREKEGVFAIGWFAIIIPLVPAEHVKRSDQGHSLSN